MPSSIGPAQTDLYTRLVAAAPTSSTQPPSKVQVGFGPPEAYEDQEVITLIGLEDPDEEAAALGNDARNESYVIVVAVKAENPSAEGLTVHERSYDLAEIVRQLVRDNPTLGSTVRTAEVVGIRPGSGTNEWPVMKREGGGFVGLLRVRVRCEARIY